MQKHYLGNMMFVSVVIIGLPLHVLGVNTAGVVIGKKNV
jgi:hypothetical protein